MTSAILERISGLEPSSETIAITYLKLFTASSFCPFYLDLSLSLDAIGVVCHQIGFLGTDLHLILWAGFVETFYLGF